MVSAPNSLTDPPVTSNLVAKHGLTPEEFERIKQILGREPNFTELGVLSEFAAVWTDYSIKHQTSNIKHRRQQAPFYWRGQRHRALWQLHRHPDDRRRDLLR